MRLFLLIWIPLFVFAISLVDTRALAEEAPVAQAPANAPPGEPLAPEPNPGGFPQTLSVPLGLQQAISFLDRARLLLEDAPATSTLAHPAALVEEVALYMEQLARLRNGIRDFQWTTIGRKKVEAGEVEDKNMETKEVVEGVTAIRFQASRGDVFVMECLLHQPDGDPLPLHLNRWVSSALPRYEVIWLPEPINVKEVFLTMRHDGESRRRLRIEIGAPLKPAFARLAHEACQAGKAFLEKGQRAAATEEIEKARNWIKALSQEQALKAPNRLSGKDRHLL